MKTLNKIILVSIGMGVMLFGFVPFSNAATSGCAQPPAGLVSWWPGDGNADDLVGANNGTLMGGTTFAPGLVGQAFSFDGIDDYVDLGNDSSLHVSAGDFTVDAWVKFNTLESDLWGTMAIVDKMGTSGINVDGWRLIKEKDNRFWFCLGGRDDNHCVDPAFTVFSKTFSNTTDWFHLAAVKSSSGISIYVNGVEEDSRSPLPNFLDSDSANLRIGSNALEGSHMNGLVDEVDIFNRALSAAEIKAIFDAGRAGKRTCVMSLPSAGARPTIDGYLWEWGALPATHLDRDNASSITGSETSPAPADLSADLRSAWRLGVLYFAAAVTDDVLVGSQSAKAWSDDAVELSLQVPSTGKTHQFTIGLDGRQYDNGVAISSLTVMTRTVAGGWTLETAIPAWVLGLDALAAGQEYPFTFGLWDDDTRSAPAQTHMLWRGTVTDTYQPDGAGSASTAPFTTSRPGRRSPGPTRPRYQCQGTALVSLRPRTAKSTQLADSSGRRPVARYRGGVRPCN